MGLYNPTIIETVDLFFGLVYSAPEVLIVINTSSISLVLSVVISTVLVKPDSKHMRAGTLASTSSGESTMNVLVLPIVIVEWAPKTLF